MRIIANTDIGRVREMNQDAYYVSSAKDELKFFILADGMGGYKGGEVASNLAIESAKKYIKANFKKIKREKESILRLLNGAVEYANTAVYEKARKYADLQDMGTTMDICLIYSGYVFIAHVGDSRVYRIRKDTIKKLTTDHSYVEKLVKEGTITREEAQNHPKKHMLMKAVGCDVLAKPDLFYRAFIKDDIILMCSDGLTNMINDEEIYNILLNNPNEPVNALINKANELGGTDNTTVVIIDNIEVEEKTKERK